jgi:hypothetical protein
VMLVEADACGKGQIGTGSYEHPTPALVVDVEVVLHDRTIQRWANCRCQRSSEPIVIIIRAGSLALRITTT